MADITMCGGGSCITKHLCERHMAVPSQWQSWMNPPVDKLTMECDYFTPVVESDRMRAAILRKQHQEAK
jgi:hypothetical protein